LKCKLQLKCRVHRRDDSGAVVSNAKAIILHADAKYGFKEGSNQRQRTRFDCFTLKGDRTHVYRFLCAVTATAIPNEIKEKSDIDSCIRSSLFKKPFIVALKYRLATDNAHFDPLRGGLVYSKSFKFSKYVMDSMCTVHIHLVDVVVNLLEHPDSPGSYFRIYVV
jgi:hypothetical protein